MNKLLILFSTVLLSNALAAQINNYSLQFDNIDDRVEFPIVNLGNDFTFIISAKNEDVTGGGEFINIGDDIFLHFIDSTAVRTNIGYNNSYYFPNPSLNYYSNSISQWNTYAITYKLDSLKLYFNGNLVINEYAPGFNVSGLLLLGDRNGTSTYNFGGKSDDLSVWSPALTIQQIQQFITCQPTGTETGLVGYWNFEEGTGVTTADQTANGNDGTLLNNIAWSTDVAPNNCCTSITINDTTNYFIADSNFITSSATYLDSTDMLTTIFGCDSIINHYSEFIFIPTYCADTAFVQDTTYITVTDTTYLTITDTTYLTVMDTTYVTVTDTSYIAVTDTLIIDITLTGGAPPNNTNTLKVYPNPANDVVIIDNGNFTSMANYRVVIVNSLGQEVFNSLISIPQFQIAIATLGAEGLYYIQVFDDSNTLIDTRKLILN